MITRWGGVTRRNYIVPTTSRSSIAAALNYSSKNPRRPLKGTLSFFLRARYLCAVLRGRLLACSERIWTSPSGNVLRRVSRKEKRSTARSSKTQPWVYSRHQFKGG